MMREQKVPRTVHYTDNDTNIVFIKNELITERKRLWRNLKNLYNQKNLF